MRARRRGPRRWGCRRWRARRTSRWRGSAGGGGAAAAPAVAPDVAQRRRSQAERERARVTVFREESGAVGLSGRDLPAAQALAGHASVLARAKEYDASGRCPGKTASGLQALAYLHLLNGVSAADAIAFARAAGAEPPDGGPPDARGNGEGRSGSQRPDT